MSSPTDGDPDAATESQTEIMEATSRALCEHGYADLTLQKIADEVDKSRSLLHYHFDTKEELLVAFIDYLLDEFRETMVPPADAPPKRRLQEFLDLFVLEPDEDDRIALHLALLEFRSRGPFNEAYREQLAKSDEVLRETVADILRDGIDAGTFRDVDPDATARMIVAALDGARTRQITLDDAEYTSTVRRELQSWIVEPLLTDGPTGDERPGRDDPPGHDQRPGDK